MTTRWIPITDRERGDLPRAADLLARDRTVRGLPPECVLTKLLRSLADRVGLSEEEIEAIVEEPLLLAGQKACDKLRDPFGRGDPDA